jgi:hypothetical protein
MFMDLRVWSLDWGLQPEHAGDAARFRVALAWKSCCLAFSEKRGVKPQRCQLDFHGGKVRWTGEPCV